MIPELIFGAAILAAFYWFAIVKNGDGMTRLQQFQLGKSLSDMTTVYEQIELTRHTMPFGAGGGADSLTPYQQQHALRVFALGELRVKSCGPMVTTRELLKNIALADRFGRDTRVDAQLKLLDKLIDDDLAVKTEWFL